jgi:uncharacterized protein (TIGR02246 family)
MKTIDNIFWGVLSIIFLLSVSSVFAAELGLNPAGEAFVKAFKANDLEAVVALYAPDAVLFPPDEMIADGKEAIRKSYEGLMNNFTIQDIVITDAQHETLGKTSYGWGRYSMTFVPKAGGEPIHMEGRFTDVSKLMNGRWLYVVDHASVPLPPPPQTQKTAATAK